MKPRRWFLRIYLILALIFGLLGLSDSILSLLEVSSAIYSLIMVLVPFLFFFFNIIAIPTFHHHRAEKIAFVLPIYHIVTYILFIGLAFVLFSMDNIHKLVETGIITIGLLTSAFEIGFSIYLLKRFGLFTRERFTLIR